MKIERMNKGNWGKIRAFFDLQTEEGFTIKGFKLVEGINGLFVGFPSQKGSDDEYHDTVWADRDVKELVNQLAVKTYGQEVMSSPPGMEHDNFPPPPEPGESEVPATVPFSDEDVVFIFVNGEATSDTWQHPYTITVENTTPEIVVVTSDFSATPTSGIAPLTVQFTNLSTAENTSISQWLWEFGDGEESYVWEPDHTYLNAGNYTVTLTAGDGNYYATKEEINYIIIFY